MNQHRRRTARAIAIARTQENRTRDLIKIGVTTVALAATAVFALLALIA